jgi:ketosteroid isomerase-like protein
MRRLVLTAGIAAAMLGNALASELELVCVKAGDERKIEVVAPGVVGKSCDVQYSRAASTNVSTPYHANNSQDYCMLKAAELAETLKASGYACAPVGVLRTEAAPVAPAAVTPVATASAPAAVTPEPAPAISSMPEKAAPAAPAPTNLPPTEIIATLAPLPAAAPIAVPETAPVATAPTTAAPVSTAAIEPPAAATPTKISNSPAEPASNVVRVADAALEDKMSQILAEPPAPQTAPAPEAFKGPAQLTAQIDEPLPGARPTAPVGRLVGATPEPRAAVSVTPAAVTQAAPAAEPAAAPEEKAPPPPEEAKPAPAPAAVVEAKPAAAEPVATAPEAAAPAKAAKRSKSAKRTPADIVLATLNAQVAAWNEGNLDAFMNIYWKSDDLKFISGVKMTKGWSSTLKRYREDYADDNGLGRLSVDKTDVEMVTDDVAIVTGRFTHNKDGVNTGGAFSLVWKRINGQWRIVHDHSAVDPVAP